jgi:hypothetical protein
MYRIYSEFGTEKGKMVIGLGIEVKAAAADIVRGRDWKIRYCIE